MVSSDPASLVAQAEQRYSDKLDAVAGCIFADREKRIVMLAGPSASGKTTTAGLIASRLEERGARTFTVSLDDFYNDQRDAILDENGNPDYEAVDALDVALIDSCLEDIIKKGTTRLPRFDFSIRQKKRLFRAYNARQGRRADSRGHPRPEPRYNRTSA